jgi:hypothetical protein
LGNPFQFVTLVFNVIQRVTVNRGGFSCDFTENVVGALGGGIAQLGCREKKKVGFLEAKPTL